MQFIEGKVYQLAFQDVFLMSGRISGDRFWLAKNGAAFMLWSNALDKLKFDIKVDFFFNRYGLSIYANDLSV